MKIWFSFGDYSLGGKFPLGGKFAYFFRMQEYTEFDADPIIADHAIHWIMCLETYSKQRSRFVGNTWDLKGDFPETCIYILRCNKQRCIISFRGTDDTKDLYDDYEITMNRVFPRKAQAIKLLDKIFASHPNISVELCGHSLGGAIAREVGKEYGLSVVTFNAAAPPTAPAINTDKEVNYHIVFDIISAWQSPYVVRIDKGFNPFPSWWQRPFFASHFYASFNDVLNSHSLVNFSNERVGRVVCGEEESFLFDSWLQSVPVQLRLLLLGTLFGISGSKGFPPLAGCFGK